MLETLRGLDKDLFLSVLFLPEAAQESVAALYAFSAELARIPALVSEPQIGEIRLQWWSDTIASFGDGGVQDHPVAAALAKVVSRYGLPLKALTDMVEARRFDLYADRFPGLTALEGYYGEVQSAVFQLAAMVVAAEDAKVVTTAAGLTGVAFGLSRSLVSNDTTRWPVNVDKQALAQLAEKRLAEFRVLQSEVPKKIWPVFLPAALTSLYLAAVISDKSEVPQWRKQWRLWRAAQAERI
jgi:15-cis-phytoene synthase